MTRLALFAVAGVLLAAPLQAQHQHGASGAAAAEAEHNCPMHQAGGHGDDPLHGFMPKMVLKHADGLKLTTSQVARLEELQATHKKDCEESKTGLKAADEAAKKLLGAAQPDLRAYEARLREAAEFRIRCQLGMVTTAQSAKAVLTSEQIGHLTHMNHAGH